MKLRLLLHSSILTALLCLLAMGWLYGRYYEQNLQQVLNNKLEERRQALHSFYNTQLMIAELYARSPDVVDLSKRLLQASANGRPSEQLIQASRDLFLPALTAQGLHGFFIVAPDGRNLTSARDINLNRQHPVAHKQPTLFRYALNGHAVMSTPLESDVPLLDSSGRLREKRPTMFSIAPVSDQGKVIALLTFRLDPLESLQNVLNQVSLSFQAECFLLNEQGVFLSSRHYDADNQPTTALQREYAVLNMLSRTPQGQATPMAKAIAVHTSGRNLSGYTDYRGQKVIGVWHWDNKLRAGIGIEADYADAYRNLHYLYSAGFFAGFLLLLVWFSLNYLLHKKSQLAQLPSTRNILHTLLSHIPDGTILFNDEGIILFINHRACEILGCDAKSVIQQDLLNLLTRQHSTEKHYSLALGIRNIVAQQHVQDVFFNQQDAEIAVKYSIEVLPDYFPCRGMLIFNLLPQASQTTIANNTSLHSIQPLKHMANAVSLVLNHCSGYLQMLTHENNPHERAVLSAEMHSSVSLMHKTMAYHIEHALLQHNLLPHEPKNYHIFPLLRACVDEIKSALHNKKTALYINVSTDFPMTIECDGNILSQLLNHLICHCLRSPAEGAIEINLHCENHNMLHITLQSSAPGLPAALLQKSLGPDISEHLREQGDLWFCEKLVELLQGSFNIESDPQIGTSIWLNIPVKLHEYQTLAGVLPEYLMDMNIVLDIANPMLRTWVYNNLQPLGLHLQDQEQAQDQPGGLITDKQNIAPDFTGHTLLLGNSNLQVQTLTLPATPLDLCNALLQWRPQVKKLAVIAAKNKRILLVEDNEVNQEVAKGLLEIIGLECEIAENGEVALQKILQQKFDLVLMDIQMPVMDGLTATRRIREMPQFADLPIVALSAQNSAQDIANSLQAGMNEHLCKPISLENLQKSLQNWLGPL
ncbi:MAG: response regulator [Oceanospirillaceae bacterium]|nr:response regulator [Oceanospirillaceae bacterium]MCP5349920.1 response regulator [Oceanospirillaceae bacterium]